MDAVRVIAKAQVKYCYDPEETISNCIEMNLDEILT